MAQMLFAKLVAMLIPVGLTRTVVRNGFQKRSCKTFYETVFKNGCAKLFMKRFSETVVQNFLRNGFQKRSRTCSDLRSSHESFPL